MDLTFDKILSTVASGYIYQYYGRYIYLRGLNQLEKDNFCKYCQENITQSITAIVKLRCVASCETHPGRQGIVDERIKRPLVNVEPPLPCHQSCRIQQSVQFQHNQVQLLVASFHTDCASKRQQYVVETPRNRGGRWGRWVRYHAGADGEKHYVKYTIVSLLYYTVQPGFAHFLSFS